MRRASQSAYLGGGLKGNFSVTRGEACVFEMRVKSETLICELFPIHTRCSFVNLAKILNVRKLTVLLGDLKAEKAF